MNPHHSSANDSWRTPHHIVALVHELFDGPPDLDPASSLEANGLIQAHQILTREDDALSEPWPPARTVWLNPPGGALRGPLPDGWPGRSIPALFWRRLATQFEAGLVDHALFLGFTLEILRTAQGYHWMRPTDFPFCVPRNRLRFLGPDGEPGKSPAHANVVVCLTRDGGMAERFRDLFGQVGAVVVPG